MVVSLLLLFSIILLVDSTPTIDMFEKKFITTRLYGICIRNCAQCKKMYVDFFDGQLCADACVKFKGKIIPDCEDLASISPFLVKFE
ncbi:Eclosion hormone [Carabus blaptoides fortunei]